MLTTSLTKAEDVCDGAEEQNRTVDTRIFSPLLYLLSYLGPMTCAKDAKFIL